MLPGHWTLPPREPFVVLVVDDDDYMLDYLSRAVRRTGCEVLSAGTYNEAFRIAKETPPHLAIIDVRLHGAASGIGLARAIHEHSPGTIIGLLTAYSLTSKTRRQAEQRAQAALTYKPISRAVLHEGIRRAREGRLPWPTVDEAHPPRTLQQPI